MTVGVSMYVLSISRLSEVDMVILAEITYVHHSETIYYSFIYTTYYNQPTNYIVTEYQTMFTLSALERRLPVTSCVFTFISKRSFDSASNVDFCSNDLVLFQDNIHLAFNCSVIYLFTIFFSSTTLMLLRKPCGLIFIFSHVIC